MKTVKQVSHLTGLSIRMLHHYDKIGLFKPSKFSKSGYRLYSDDDLEILQQILFFKELDFPLKEIKNIINNPSFDRKKALINHKDLLILKRNRLNKLINLVDKTLKEEMINMSFKEFDVSELKKIIKKYADEAEKLYGQSTAYKEFKNKTANYSEQDWYQTNKDADIIILEFIDLIDKGPSSAETQAQVQKWKDFITNNWYNCTNEILLGLGKMYVEDARFKENFNKHKEGLAEFINKAIQIYCK